MPQHGLRRFAAGIASAARRHPRLLLAVGAFAIIALAALILTNRTITLRDDGFAPRTLTIQAGETITFRSERGKYFWPASDFHPTHALYPDFDPKKPLPPGGSWSYTFTEPGVYPFHDHLGAYYFGFIRVKDADGNVPDDCMQRGGKLRCWENEIFAALAERGLSTAYDVVERLYRVEPTFSASCHTIAHNIGLASYQFYRKDPSTILSTKAAVCAGGFYHGFMEGYLGAEGSPTKAAAVCDAIGDALHVAVPDARLQCFHGIGHGAIETMIASTGDFGTLDEVVARSLALCEEASSGTDERYRCVSGLYNGIANFYINGEYGLTAAKQDPLALCSRQPEAYKDACYGNFNSFVAWQAEGSLGKGFAYLLTMPDPVYRRSAVKYLAGLLTVPHLKDTDYAPLLAECRALPAAYRSSCVAGFAHGFLEHGEPGQEYLQALAFCATPGLTGTDLDACYEEAIGHLPGWYSAASSTAICALAPASAQRYCRQ